LDEKKKARILLCESTTMEDYVNPYLKNKKHRDKFGCKDYIFLEWFSKLFLDNLFKIIKQHSIML